MEILGALASMALLLVVSLGVLIAFKSVFIWPGEYRKRAEDIERRLLNPDIASVSRQLGTELPPALLAHHRDHEQLLQRRFEITSPEGVRFAVEWWLPLDVELLKHPLLPEQSLFIAEQEGWGEGGGWATYYVDLSDRADDPPVCLLAWDPMESELVAQRLSDFLSWPRKQLPPRVKP